MRVGRFFIDDSSMLGCPDLCLEIQSKVLIFEAVSKFGTTEFTGTCEDWDEASLKNIPIYNVLITRHEDGSRTWEWRKQSSSSPS